MFCPHCGAIAFSASSQKSFHCASCDFTYFQNVASAAAAIIVVENEVLIAIRGQEPGKGRWDFPGGFIDPQETFEEGLARELEEELGWKVHHHPYPVDMQYLCAYPNLYPYKNVTYHTLDTFFVITLDSKPPQFTANDGVAALSWVSINAIHRDNFAFDSARLAVDKFITVHDKTA